MPLRTCLFCALLVLTSSLPAQNNAGLFNGTNSRVRVLDAFPANPSANPNAYKITGNNITVEAWIFPLRFPNPHLENPIVKRPAGTTDVDPFSVYALSVTHVNGFPQPAFSISTGAPGSRVQVIAADSLPTFQWTHVAGCYDGTQLKIFVNGNLQGTVSATISIGGGAAGFYIGRFLSDAFAGLIDDVRLWNVTRSQSEIQSSMNTELTGSEPGLAGYWTMNNATGGLIPDQTVNHNDLPNQNTQLVSYNPLTSYGAPSFTMSESLMDFGSVEVGSNGISGVTITNTGTAPVIGFFGAADNLNVTTSSGIFFVDQGQTFHPTVSVTPLVPGDISGTIPLVTNAPPVSIPFTLTAIALHRFDANNISMWVRRNGMFARDPFGAGTSGGLVWPKGSGKTAIFASGIWIGATVGGTVRTAVASYQSEFTPGPVIDGAPADPNNVKYRVYKVSAGDNASTNPDYAEWPADLGAPVNNDGKPKILGDQTLFCVYNDMNPSKHFPVATDGPFGTAPLGAEVQQTTFGFNRSGALANTVFLRFKIINRSNSTWQNAYIALWSDPDLGNFADDFVGIDTNRTLGFVYNATNTDAVYGTPAPAAGYQILRGAFYTKPIQAFAFYTAGATFPLRDPTNATEAYNFMSGLRADGSQYVDPTTGNPTLFPVSGDPVTGLGWVDSQPADRRFLLSTGPFDLEPGQSKEFIAAIILAQGADNINSVTALRLASDEIQSLYNNGGVFGGAVENVSSVTVPPNQTSTLDDISNSGAQLDLTSGSGGAIIEAATYVAPPPGAQELSGPSISGVGKYLEVQASGDIQWPVQIKIYYTANDLAQAGVVESDLIGLYYWSGTADAWKLYSNSGVDDQGRGESTTGVNRTNVIINGIEYEGYVFAVAYHLTPIRIGTAVKAISQRYSEIIQYIQSIPDTVFKHPADQRRRELIKRVEESNRKAEAGNMQAASQMLESSVLNHLTIHSTTVSDVWIVSEEVRARLVSMIGDLLKTLRPLVGSPSTRRNALRMEGVLEVPREFALEQNFPNPFNPSTTIRYALPYRSPVTLVVYNVLGEEVAQLVNHEQEAGYYQLQWSPQLPSGMYVYRLQAGEFVQTRKLVLLK
ncbi:MAG TPA: LamG-like jellyroll fold domain-containing protein [Bacteroidota bacterium]|nr:LamG-like jellyroll fold domain-containing protein [Bacteroidota bacterium]